VSRRRKVGAVIVLVLLLAFATSALAQGTTAVPAEYAGDWICQTFMPGYSIVPPHADLSQPQTNRATTPATVNILRFSVKTDGTYVVAAAAGRYAFNAATNAITWLDGPHQNVLTQTQLGRRDNGAPKMEFLSNKRRYGCYIAKPK
jgi:hypothetical protein